MYPNQRILQSGQLYTTPSNIFLKYPNARRKGQPIEDRFGMFTPSNRLTSILVLPRDVLHLPGNELI